MTSSHSKPLLIVLSLISAVLATVLTLGVYSIRLKNKETSELLNRINETTKREVLFQSIRLTQDIAAEDIKAFKDIILSSDKLVLLIENIEASGKTLGLDAEILSVEEIKNTGSIGLQSIRIVIETRGSWAPTLSFLRVVENLPHRVLIDESSILKQTDSWRSKIILSLYSSD